MNAKFSVWVKFSEAEIWMQIDSNPFNHTTHSWDETYHGHLATTSQPDNDPTISYNDHNGSLQSNI